MADLPVEDLAPLWVPRANLSLVQTFADFCGLVTEGSGTYDVHVTQTVGDPEAVNSFTHSGDCWEIRCGTESTHLRDSGGLRCIAYLLAHPHEPTSVFLLAGLAKRTVTGNSPVLIEYSDPVFDTQAEQEIRDAIHELQTQLDEARESGNEDRAERAREKLERLEEFFEADRGIRGSRRFAGNSVNARQAASQALRRARQAIAREAPKLAAHLKQAITVSAFATYAPTIEIEWHVGARV
jgi:hypothetical protein